jgi:hypothetical protein
MGYREPGRYRRFDEEDSSRDVQNRSDGRGYGAWGLERDGGDPLANQVCSVCRGHAGALGGQLGCETSFLETILIQSSVGMIVTLLAPG